MEASFKSDAKTVKYCSIKLENELLKFKDQSITDNLSQSNDFDDAIKLVEKLSIINVYKLRLLKDFSEYNLQKK